MIAARCPQCGRPGPVRLAEPGRYRCPACAYDGPPPPGVADQIRAAAAVLEERDARERQLSTLQRRMIGSGFVATAIYLAALTAAMAPFSCCLGIWVVGDETGPTDYAMWFMVALPVALVAAFGGSGLIFLRSRLARVRASLAAVPPSAPGEPARCHVCGGPVASAGDAAFVRCGHCHADNLVDPRVLATLEDRREQVLDGFEAEVTRRAAVARQALGSALRGLALGAALALPASCALTGLLTFVLYDIETEPYGEIDYTLVDAPGGRCVARVRAARDRERVTLEGWEWEGLASMTEERPRAAVRTFHVDALVGLRARSAASGSDAVWTVERAVGTAGTGDNRLHLRTDEGAERVAWVTELCLVEGEAGPVSPVPLRGDAPAAGSPDPAAP